MDKNYKQFVDKLNAYIQRFYIYRLLRGFIFVSLIFLVYTAIIFTLEYFNYFEPKIKIALAIFTLFILSLVFIYFIIKPLIKLFGIGKVLSFYDVSDQLSQKYPEIRDRLINIIELSNEKHPNYSDQLVHASIAQKIEELKIFSFKDAIHFKNLKNIFIVLIGVITLYLFSYIVFPEFVRDSSVRLIRIQQRFEKPAPFTFLLKNKNLEVMMGESVELQLVCEGKELPSVMYINIGGNNFLMKNDRGSFVYKLENLNSSFTFYFTDKKYLSADYRIQVINKPLISEFTIDVIAPWYTGIKDQQLKNIGDLKIVAGSSVRWNIKTIDTDSLEIIFADSSKIHGIAEKNNFKLTKTFFSDAGYRIAVHNARLSNENSLVYKIKVVQDLFPEIKVVQVRDTLDFRRFHFKGDIIDDYGFHQLTFNLKYEDKDSLINIPFTPSFLDQEFYFSFDFESVKELGKSFSYFFTVFDNDVVNHYKKSISETFTFRFPDYQEILSKENSDINAVDQLLNKSEALTKEIMQEFNNFKMKQVNSTMSDWDKFQAVKEIVNKKNELENVLNELAKQNNDANNFLNSFSENKEEILKKQQQIEELLNEVFSDELKKLFQEFNELAKQFDPKKFDQLQQQMNAGLDDLSKQLEKNMQLLKKLKVEQKLERVSDQLKKLSISEKNIQKALDEKENLAESKENETNNEILFENIEKDYKDAGEFNKTLEKPMNLYNLDNEFSVIREKYKDAINELEKKNRKKGSEEIGENIENLEQLSFSVDQMLKKNQKKENEVNLEDLKQILDNLIFVSFDQEKLMNRLSRIDNSNPLINEARINQKNLQNQFNLLKDSLYALSKRTPEISSVVNKELLSMEQNMLMAYQNLETVNIGGARMYQQYGFTAANNLALFLSEALDNLKKEDEGMNGGDGENEKPGKKGSKPGMKMLKESQSSIKEQLQQMIDQMKTGNMGKLSKSIGQTIAQQEMMQQLIREMLNGPGLGNQAKGQLQAVEQLLEQSRKDLINRNITNELINRQNLILSKLLDAEKSEIERDFEEKRESKTATDIVKTNSDGYFEYNNQIKNQKELINRNSYKLKGYYDQKYNSFLKQLNNR